MTSFFRRVLIGLAVIGFVAGGAAVDAATYFEDFDIDPGANFGGWGGSTMTWDPTGGIGGSGALKTASTSKYATAYYSNNGSPADSINGDVNANFGPLVSLSFDYKKTSAADLGLSVFAPGADTGWYYYPLEPKGSVPTEYTHYSVDFDTTWTKAEATAAGWVSGGAGTDFSSVMSGVNYWGIMRNLAVASATGSYAAAIDNIKMITIPEPATLVMLLSGLVGMLYLSRRR